MVSSNATAKQQIDAKIQKVIALEQDLKKLKEEAERLKAENYDLQNKVLAVREQDQREGETADADRKDG